MNRMRYLVVCLLCQWVSLCTPVARAQGAAEAAAQAEPAGFRAEFVEDLKGLEEKFLKLAEAMPLERYSYGPGEGVRSFQEVLLHISSTNYTFPNMVGLKPPAGFDMRGLLALPADKARIHDAIVASFAHAREGVLGLSDADLERSIRGGWSVRRTLVFQLRHASEHLGQLIAYARMSGVTPPWTEEAQRRQQQPQPPAKQPSKPL